MARPRTPTAILDARGAFKKDPQRKREGEPEVREPIGSAPDDLTDDQRAAWQQICDQAPLGVLTEADTLAVEAAATLIADFRRARNVWPQIEEYLERDHDDITGVEKLVTELKRLRSTFGPSQYAQLIKLLGQFGMTPSERSRLSIEKPKSANAFGDL